MLSTLPLFSSAAALNLGARMSNRAVGERSGVFGPSFRAEVLAPEQQLACLRQGVRAGHSWNTHPIGTAPARGLPRQRRRQGNRPNRRLRTLQFSAQGSRGATGLSSNSIRHRIEGFPIAVSLPAGGRQAERKRSQVNLCWRREPISSQTDWRGRFPAHS